MTKQEKARKSFNYQCNKASKCRRDKYMISCNISAECNINNVYCAATLRFVNG